MNQTARAEIKNNSILTPSITSRDISLSQKEIIKGLHAEQKYLSSKHFYDQKGSVLFEKICRLEEYYPTRTEISILKQIAPAIMGKNNFSDIVELGSGEALKIKILLSTLSQKQKENIRYYPIDISEEAIYELQKTLKQSFPEIKTKGFVHDFMTDKLLLPKTEKKLFCFFGSTIGNLSKAESIRFLGNISKEMTHNDHFLLGFDNVKDLTILEAAYNDSRGVTAEFNLNILKVINEKIDANFNVDFFEHKAFFNVEKSRIEMHLIAKTDHWVSISSIDEEIHFKKGETIHTENSRKYTFDMIRELAGKSGFIVKQWHTDPNEWFTVAELRKA